MSRSDNHCHSVTQYLTFGGVTGRTRHHKGKKLIYTVEELATARAVKAMSPREYKAEIERFHAQTKSSSPF